MEPICRNFERPDGGAGGHLDLGGGGDRSLKSDFIFPSVWPVALLELVGRHLGDRAVGHQDPTALAGHILGVAKDGLAGGRHVRQHDVVDQHKVAGFQRAKQPLVIFHIRGQFLQLCRPPPHRNVAQVVADTNLLQLLGAKLFLADGKNGRPTLDRRATRSFVAGRPGAGVSLWQAGDLRRSRLLPRTSQDKHNGQEPDERFHG